MLPWEEEWYKEMCEWAEGKDWTMSNTAGLILLSLIVNWIAMEKESLYVYIVTFF